MRSIVRIASPVAVMLACVAVAAAAERQRDARGRPDSTPSALSAPGQGRPRAGRHRGHDARRRRRRPRRHRDRRRERHAQDPHKSHALALRTRHVPGGGARFREGHRRPVDGGLGGHPRHLAHAKDLKVAISGSGDVRIETLAANDLQVSIAGSGDMCCRAARPTWCTPRSRAPAT